MLFWHKLSGCCWLGEFSERYDAAEGFRLRQEFAGEVVEDEDDGAQVDFNVAEGGSSPVGRQWFSDGVYEGVGNGRQTNPWCGSWGGLKGCLREELHGRSHLTVDGCSDHKGLVYLERGFRSCDNPSCPVCYRKGWAFREAGNIDERIEVARKLHGYPEHVVYSIPKSEYDLDLGVMRGLAVRRLRSRRIVGGVMIFHAFRFNKRSRVWDRGFHFHVLGFILGGYQCRGCSHWAHRDCKSDCDGFQALAWKLQQEDGCFVKVLGRRKKVLAKYRVSGKPVKDNIFGTAWYQLNHASVKIGVERFHVATWFGTCSYRRLKVTREVRERLCPLCQHELVPVRYFGSRVFDPSEARSWLSPLVEDGRVMFYECEYGKG